MKQLLFIFLTSLIFKTTYCQSIDSSKVNRIDFLNIDGEFTTASFGGKDLYYDPKKESLFGVFAMGIPGVCGNDKDTYTEQVFVNGKKIIDTEYKEFDKKKLVSIFQENDTLYFYIKLIPITEFLKENTNNAILVPANEITINGKKPKMYFESKYVLRIDFRGKRIFKKKLRNRYRKKSV